MRMNKNVFTVVAALLVVLVLFCMTQSEGFALPTKVTVSKGPIKINPANMGFGGVVTQL
jgi:hypothetical protein